MADLKGMTGAELLERLDQIEKSLRLAHQEGGAVQTSVAVHALTQEGQEIRVEIKARLDGVKESIAAYEEARRKEAVQSFAFASGVAVCGLWKAHGGRSLTDAESKELGRLLHGFFVKLRPGEGGGTQGGWRTWTTG